MLTGFIFLPMIIWIFYDKMKKSKTDRIWIAGTETGEKR